MELVSYIQDIEGFTGSAVFLRQIFILPLMYQNHFYYKPFRLVLSTICVGAFNTFAVYLTVVPAMLAAVASELTLLHIQTSWHCGSHIYAAVSFLTYADNTQSVSPVIHVAF
jgi:hypothetical protein